MKKIRYGSKEEFNQMREEEFLALSGSQRVEIFLKMMDNLKVFPVKNQRLVEEKGNFIITKKMGWNSNQK